MGISYRKMLVGFKWIAVTVSYTIASIILSAILSFTITLALSRGTGFDDSPSSGLFLGFLFLLILPIFLFLGLSYFVELIHNRIRKQCKLLWRHVGLRWLLCLASIIGPAWIIYCWPPPAYRGEFQSRGISLLIYGLSIGLALLALGVRFRARAQVNAANERPDDLSPSSY